jgi:hypothetical protein
MLEQLKRRWREAMGFKGAFRDVERFKLAAYIVRRLDIWSIRAIRSLFRLAIVQGDLQVYAFVSSRFNGGGPGRALLLMPSSFVFH